MKNLIVKYILILIGAIVFFNLFWFIYSFIFPFIETDLELQLKITKFGMPALHIIVRAIIALFIWKDMIRLNTESNYLILLLILIDEYWGIGFFLLSHYFENYISNNKQPYAKEN